MATVYIYLTGEENHYYFGLLNKIPLKILNKRVEYLLKKMNLWEFRKDCVFNFSVGMKRKLAISSCLINAPEIVIVDEPWVGLDVIFSEEVQEAIRVLALNKKKIFIITNHRIDYIDGTVEEFWIYKGRVVLNKTIHDIEKVAAKKILLFTVKQRVII